MTHIIHRSFGSQLPTAVGGEGPYVIDQTGKRYLDACSGAAVSCFGYSDAEITEAVRQQMDKMPFVHSSFFTTDILEELGDKLLERAPKDMDKVYLVSGGSEAMEAALKLARQYYFEIGQPQRKHIISRRQSYHGNTLTTLAVGGNKPRREMFEPLLLNTHHVSPCFAYHEQLTTETEEQYAQRLADELEAKIQELGADQVMCFVAETVVGSTAGAVPPVEGYFKKIRAVCDKYGVLLLLDEIMCGMGRTGTLHACEQDGISPDLMTVAKGIGAGYQPLGGVYVTKKICEALQLGRGAFQHGHTYICHAAAAAAGVAVQKKLTSSLLQRNREVGDQIVTGLTDALKNHPNFGDIRGRGLFRAIEIVQDKSTKQPFDPSKKIANSFKKIAMEEGLMTYPANGTIDGVNGDHVLFAPPFIYQSEQVTELVEKVVKTFNRILP